MTTIATNPPSAPENRTDVPGITRPMTYEEYLSTPEEMRRYDILDGWKVYRLYGPEGERMPNPTRRHQRVQGNLYAAFRDYEISSESEQALQPPCDVLVRHLPLRSRQPDLLFTSNQRLANNAPETDAAPLNPAPELVVEIVSPSDRPGVLRAKISDYYTANVREIWVVRTEPQTIEVIGLASDEIETLATYGRSETVTSAVFPGLSVPGDAVFRR